MPNEQPFTGDVSKFISRNDMDKLISEGRAQRFTAELEDGVYQGWKTSNGFVPGCLVIPNTSYFAEQARLDALENPYKPKTLVDVFQGAIPVSTPEPIKSNFKTNIIAKIVAAAIATGGGGFAAYDKINDLVARIEVLEAQPNTMVNK